MGMDVAILQRLIANTAVPAALIPAGLAVPTALAVSREPQCLDKDVETLASLPTTPAAVPTGPGSSANVGEAIEDVRQPPAALALACAINSNSHPREYKLFQRACGSSHSELAQAWASGGSRRMRTFLSFVQAGCNAEATEAMIASEATKSKEVRYEGEYLSAEDILKGLCFDTSKAAAFMARKREEEDGVIIDPNDGTTNNIFWASNQKSASSSTQKKTMVVRAAAEPNAAFVNMMTGMTQAASLDDVSGFSSFADSQGSACATPTGGQHGSLGKTTMPKHSPPAKKAKAVKDAVLSVEEALEKDPRAYALLWSNGLMNDIGKGEITAMKLEGMDCQEELCGKLRASAAA